MTDSTTQTPAVPTEMMDALQDVIRRARDLEDLVARSIETASNWANNREAYPFPMTGNIAHRAGDLEAAIAKYEAFRSVARKLADR